MVKTQGMGLAPGMNCPRASCTFRNVCCRRSSAVKRSPTMLRIKASTRGASRAYRASMSSSCVSVILQFLSSGILFGTFLITSVDEMVSTDRDASSLPTVPAAGWGVSLK